MQISDKVYDKIAKSILDKMEQGQLIWNRTWKSNDLPINIASKHSFSGWNAIYLSFVGMDYKTSRWMTYNQALDLGGQVRKGEKGSIGFRPMFLKSKTRKDKNGNAVSFTTYNAVTYFNVDQIDGLPEEFYKLETETRDFNKIEKCEQIVNAMPKKPEIKHEKQKAFYHPKDDFVNMPKPETFISDEEYYSVLFHELAHSTGHETRLNRDTIKDTRFGDHAYSEEELVAEFTASFLCGVAGIEKAILDNSAAYIQSWSKKLSQDMKILIKAANKAQKAADYIQNKHIEKEVIEVEQQAA